jgi:hypothetical protein
MQTELVDFWTFIVAVSTFLTAIFLIPSALDVLYTRLALKPRFEVKEVESRTMDFEITTPKGIAIRTVCAFYLWIDNLGISAAENAVVYLKSGDLRFGVPVPWGAMYHWKRPLKLTSETELKSKEEFREFFVQNYFRRPEFEEEKLQAGVGHPAVIFFAVEGDNVARIPTDDLETREIPFRETVTISVSSDNFRTFGPFFGKTVLIETWNRFVVSKESLLSRVLRRLGKKRTTEFN